MLTITVSNLTKKYSQDIVALDDVSLTISEGMFGLVGPNGAGKTTLMRIIATLLEPTKGSVKVGEFDVRKNKREIRKILGYLPQNFGIYPELTAYEFLDYMCLLHGMKDRKRREEQIIHALELVHLLDVKDRLLGTFSGGMIQRIGIAQSLLNSPQLLIVDEPTAGLDPEERVTFRNLLSELSSDRVIIISTHIVGDITSTCSDMAILKNGKIFFKGKPTDLIGQTRGRVFTAQVTDGELKQIKKQVKIISITRELDTFDVRFVSERYFDGAVEVKPTLEDAYIYAMEFWQKE